MALVNFSAGLSALQVNQQVLDLLGQNIANVNTPSYHRREALLAARYVTENPIGFGVEIAQIRRLRDAVLEQAVMRHSSELAELESRLPRLAEIEARLGTGPQSLRSLLNEFFDQLDQLGVRPADLTARRLVVDAAQRLASRFQDLNNQMLQLRGQLVEETKTAISQANDLAMQIADLNAQIARAAARGVIPHDALDRRDQLLNQLAELIGVQVIEQPLQQVNVLANGILIVSGDTTIPLQTKLDEQNRLQIVAQGVSEPINVSSGSVAGLLNVHNEVIRDVVERLNRLAREVMSRLDGIHVTGLGLPGGFRVLNGVRSVNNVNTLLERAGLAFPVHAGTVWVSITDQATGARTLHAVSINPATQTLADVAAALSAVPHLQAIANPQTSTLQLLAEPGYSFDFAGRMPTQPITSITGTAQPTVTGTYTGSQNDTYTVTAINSGTVGLTPNLTLEVRNSAGQLLNSVQVGQGYVPGSVVSLAEGLTLQLSAGTLNAGDAFQVPVVAQPDTSGLLTALGINTLFAGTDASNIAVHPEVALSPERLAVSQSGAPAEAGRLRQMLAVRDTPVFSDSGLTLIGFYDRLVADLGAQVQATQQTQDHLQAVGEQLRAEQQAISGVDPNEELVRLLQYQRAFQLAARFILVVNETFDELLRLV
ncbi:Flagellar hook-associated protein 1 [bacterium HR36]|nr:Flagellar hook-associated protein 1 [bacterium HR36]